jgi:signal transduction histidine kinase
MVVADSAIKVLTIEDDEDTQANLCDILELDGYRVESAMTLNEVLKRTNWREISVILLDRKLPDGTADTLLPQIKKLAPEAAVIIITGHADMDGTITALRYGASDYLLKPIDPDMLRATLARVAKLKKAEERALQAERLAAIGQMITIMTHESGNALARARALLDMLAAEVGDQPEILPLINGIQKAHADLVRLYDDVRGYAAPLKLNSEMWDVGVVWRQAWANLAVLRQGKQADLVEETGGIDLYCLVDQFRLEQVFRNLFENALAACPAPVRIEIRCSESTHHDRLALSVTVRDNGPGLRPEQRRKVFEPFYTTKSKGTGLGLAIAKRIIEAHGGLIGVTDSEGPGAEFVLLLPRASEQELVERK